MTDAKANQIPDIAKKLVSSKEICKRLPFSNATVYRKISNLSEIGLLRLVGADDDNDVSLQQEIERLRYVRTFLAISVRCGNLGECQCHFEYPLVQIASKKEFLGTILRTIREHQY